MGASDMGNHHSKRGPVEGCPQPDSREVKPNAITYIAQRPSRRIPHAIEGTPQSLRVGPVTPEWLAIFDKVTP